MRLAGALWFFWLCYGYLNEGRHYVEDVLARSGGLGSQLSAGECDLTAPGHWPGCKVIIQTARLRLEESLALARALGDKRLIAEVLVHLGWVTLYHVDTCIGRSLI